MTNVTRGVWFVWFVSCLGAAACQSQGLLGLAIDGGTSDAAADAPAAPDGAPPPATSLRLLAPMSTSTVTQQRPTLHWTTSGTTAEPVVELCRDRACTQPIAIDVAISADQLSGRPVAELPAGWVFWRVHTGAQTSATWQLWVGAASATTPVDSSSGTTFDVNGDGFADVLVGASGGDVAHIFLGNINGTGFQRVDIVSPDAVPDNFGASVADIGDVDGDGYPDFAIGAYNFGGLVGEAHVYLGGPDLDAAQWNGPGAARRIDLASPFGAFGGFGYAVSAAGDVDGDGYADFLVSAPLIGESIGEVALYRGGPTPAADRLVIANPVGVEYTGATPGAAGDINGDGYADFVIGANANDSSVTISHAFVYLGGPELALANWQGANPPLRIELTSVVAVAPFGGAFGQTVAPVGDVDGDGYSDFLIGAPQQPDGGAAYLYLGGATPGADWLGPTAAKRVDFAGPADDSFFGIALAGAGDLDGDGHADFVISGADDVDLENFGATHVYMGAAQPSATGTRIDLASPDGANSYFGYSVSALGDLDGDGRSELGVGAPGASAVHIYASGPTGLVRSDLENPDGATAWFGGAVQ